jgi:hypothetical protein
MERRTVLKGLGAGGLVVAAGGVVGWRLLDDQEGDDTPSEPTLATPEPQATLGDALVAVGSAYLEQVPDEADVDTLLAALPALGGEVPDDPGHALQVLAPAVVADVEAGEVVALDGWVLTRTECRAAALYAV